MLETIRFKQFTQLWGSASPFFSSTTKSRRLGSYTSTYPDLARRAFSQARPSIAASLPQKISRYAVTRSFASSGILLFGINPGTTASTSALTSYSSVIEKTLGAAKTLQRRHTSRINQKIWARAIHSSSRRRIRAAPRRNKNIPADGSNTSKVIKKDVQPQPSAIKPDKITNIQNSEAEADGYFHLPHMPKMPHRPTKEELLAAATGFWSRLRVRFKWFSIRSVRPWNVDDWSAFVSWFVLGHIVWILVGTTTFFSLLIFTINTVVAQGMTCLRCLITRLY
jgi:distribution and morphology protein 31